jgi:phosphohistidine phosphatase
MKRLIIIRHAVFKHDDPLVGDINCPLTWQGHRHVSESAGKLAKEEFCPDLIVSSPALRTRETAQIVAEKLGLSPEGIQIADEIFEAERPEILRVVQGLDDSAETVVLVGHHPGVSLLLNHLADSTISEISPGAYAAVELTADRWRDVSFKRGKLIEYYAPKINAEKHGLWWRFKFWRRQRVHKIELAMVFIVGVLVVLAIIALIVSTSTDQGGMPDQGSGGRIKYFSSEP